MKHSLSVRSIFSSFASPSDVLGEQKDKQVESSWLCPQVSYLNQIILVDRHSAVGWICKEAKCSGIADLKEQVQASESSKRIKYQLCSYSASSQVTTLNKEVPIN